MIVRLELAGNEFRITHRDTARAGAVLSLPATANEHFFAEMQRTAWNGLASVSITREGVLIVHCLIPDEKEEAAKQAQPPPARLEPDQGPEAA